MARRRLRKQTDLLPWLGRALGRLLQKLFGHPQAWASLVVVVVAVVAVSHAARHSEAFRLERIILPPGSTLQAPAALIGQNLWTIDLERVADQLQSQQPQLKRVRVIRQLPNTLAIEISKRAPIGQVRLASGRWHPVDVEGFVLAEAQAAAWDHLVMVNGTEQGRPVVKAGAANTNERLVEALRLIAWLRRSPALIGHRLTAIEMADPRQVILIVDEDVEIRCGSETQLAQQLRRLRRVWKLLASQPVAVRYIDVRFAEPVVGQRVSASAQ